MEEQERSVEIIEHYSGGELTTLFIQGKEWVPIETLQAERKKRDEVVGLTKLQIIQLQSLREICIEDDLLDLPSYDSISRADKISDAWEALKVIEALTQPNQNKP